MKKISLFNVLLFATAILFAGASLSSCGSGDDNKSNPEDNNGQSSDEDFGSDGLKGYWVQNTWNQYRPNYDKVTGYRSSLFYFDGEGGGTLWYWVTTLDNVENKSKYVADKIGTFYDTVDGSTKDYFYTKFFMDISPLAGGGQSEEVDTRTYAIEYFVRGTTMSIYFGSESMMLNVSTGSKTSSGSINNFHTLKKVN